MFLFIFFFKQKTAYEMRISDWSSDVCSSDLPAAMVDRQVIEWDKDDIDALKFMKVDVLALGMLTCMKRGLDLLADHKGVHLDLATIPAEDTRPYAMIRKADTLGTFQIESHATM